MDKQSLRAMARDIRAGISDEQRRSDAVALKENVIAELSPLIHIIKAGRRDTAYHDPITIGTYYSIRTEIEPPHQVADVTMALPIIMSGNILKFYPWSPDKPLVKGDFDIPVPDIRGLVAVRPDILLMPLLLCDMAGNRLGYGAGHYDRYIDSVAGVRPFLIGLCFDEQIWPEPLPSELHDQRLDLIITPRRVAKVAFN